MRAIGNFFVVIRAETLFHVGDDMLRNLFHGIRGNNAVIRILISHPAHQRTLWQSRSPPPNQKVDEMLEKFAKGLEDVEQRIIAVGVIHKNLKLPLARDCFEPSRDLRRARQLNRFAQIDPHAASRSKRPSKLATLNRPIKGTRADSFRASS